MKYPEHGTESKPVTGEAAKELLAAIDAGEGILTEAGRQTIERILEHRRRKQKQNGQTDQEVSGH